MLEFKAPPQIPHLKWTLTLEVNAFSLYDGSNDSNELIYTALVTWETGVDISLLKKTCAELGLICPLEKFSEVVDKKPIMKLLYRPFRTMDTYMQNSPVLDSEFVLVMRGIIEGLNKLHVQGYDPCLTKDTIVVKGEDKKGSILIIDTDKGQGKLSDSVCNSNFQEVHDVIVNSVTTTVPLDLDTVLLCMLKATSESQRQRLLEAPYFHSASELVYGFITRLHKAMIARPEFIESMRAELVTNVTRAAMYNKHTEVTKVWEMSRPILTNYYDILRFIRNCVQHLNEHWSKIPEGDRRNAQALYNTPPYQRVLDASPLMIQPRLFLDDIVFPLVPNFLNLIFRKSYEIKTMIDGIVVTVDPIPILDKLR